MKGDFLVRLSQSCSVGYVDGETCLARCYVVLGEMLRYRGYEHVRFTCSNHAELISCVEMDSVVAAATCGSREDKVVIFHSDSRVGVKAVRSIVDSGEHGSSSVMIVSIEGPTSFARRDSGCSEIEFVTFKQIFNNISSHQLVPPHRRITCPEEKRCIERKFCISGTSQWPRFLQTDPMCAFGDFRSGDLIEIRRSCSIGENIYYRMVC